MLVIFDDEEKLLLRYVRRFTALGYDVKPVLVLGEDREHDKDLFIGGHLKRDWTEEERETMKDSRWQDERVKVKPDESVIGNIAQRTVLSALENAKERRETNARYKDEYEYFRCLSQIPYGVKNIQEARALLEELKPDAVLSDNQMRAPDYVPEGTELMGKDVMQLAQMVCPDAPRAIHSGMYKINPAGNEEHLATQKRLLENARAEPTPFAHNVFPKQESQSRRSHLAAGPVREIDAYFRHGLHNGKSPGIFMGALEEKSWEEMVTESQARQRPTVLVIDDKFDELKRYAKELHHREFNVIAVHVPMNEGPRDEKMPCDIPLHKAWAVRDVLRLVRELKPDCVLSDSELGWENARGEELLDELRFEAPDTALALHSTKFHKREAAEGFDCFAKAHGLRDVAEYFDSQLGDKGRSAA